MTKSILIADDFEDDAELLRRTLERAGVKNPVFMVKDGEEAIAFLNGNGQYADRDKFPLPGVVLLDLKMPKANGFQVLDWMRFQPQHSDVLKIVLSGHHELKEVNEAYRLGARSFFLKPCNVQDVQNLMRAFPSHWKSEPSVSPEV
jgi:CheY-like chemotaxis protein